MLIGPRKRNILIRMLGFIALTLAMRASAAPISVTWDEQLVRQYSGKIYLFVSKSGATQPRLMGDWDNLGPIAVKTVKGAAAAVGVEFDSDAVSTTLLSALPSGEYTAQAVMERNPAAAEVGDADGNIYSTPVTFKVGGSAEPVRLLCDQVVMEPTVNVGPNVKVVELESIPISNAQRRAFVWRAAVVLPNEYASQPTKQFPVVIDIPDEGQSWTDYPGRGTNKAAYVDGKPVIYVRVEAEGPMGYHLFANSMNTGPWVTALTQEFLPYVAKEYHGDSNQVSLTGKGAGGWSALWLIANMPDAFVGARATEPATVDFHQFHGLNLYTDTNAFGDPQSTERRWLRTGNQTWREHADVEAILRGLPIAAWEADFSPKAKNNKVVPLFDRKTGAIDPVVAKAWQAYDLDAYLKDNWAALGPKLAGKVTIVTGGADADFSDDALKMFKIETEALGAKFLFEPAPSAEVARG